jgi:hypothetical protein
VVGITATAGEFGEIELHLSDRTIVLSPDAASKLARDLTAAVESSHDRREAARQAWAIKLGYSAMLRQQLEREEKC